MASAQEYYIFRIIWRACDAPRGHVAREQVKIIQNKGFF